MASVIEKTIRSAFTPVIGAVANFNRKRMTAPEGGHPYLTGIHKPMTEELTLENLTVEGSIPTQLDGRYLRIGPNPVTAPDEASYHWFIGDGMTHGVRIVDGKAEWYPQPLGAFQSSQRCLGRRSQAGNPQPAQR